MPKIEKSNGLSECFSTETGHKTCKYQKTGNIRIGRYRMQKNYEKVLLIIIKHEFIMMSIPKISRMNTDFSKIRILGIKTIVCYVSSDNIRS